MNTNTITNTGEHTMNNISKLVDEYISVVTSNGSIDETKQLMSDFMSGNTTKMICTVWEELDDLSRANDFGITDDEEISLAYEHLAEKLGVTVDVTDTSLAVYVANGLAESPVGNHMEHISINSQSGTVTGWSTYNGPGHPLNVRAFTITVKVD